MLKEIYFDRFDAKSWPNPSELERYFLAPPAQRWTFETGNDHWGLSVKGAEGTGHLEKNEGRIDVHLSMCGHRRHGVLLIYSRWDGVQNRFYNSKGDLSRLGELAFTLQDSPLPVGLFIPYDKAWGAVKEFMETDGALPKSIEWIASRDLPPGTFPDPVELRRRRLMSARKS